MPAERPPMRAPGISFSCSLPSLKIPRWRRCRRPGRPAGTPSPGQAAAAGIGAVRVRSRPKRTRKRGPGRVSRRSAQSLGTRAANPSRYPEFRDARPWRRQGRRNARPHGCFDVPTAAAGRLCGTPKEQSHLAASFPIPTAAPPVPDSGIRVPGGYAVPRAASMSSVSANGTNPTISATIRKITRGTFRSFHNTHFPRPCRRCSERPSLRISGGQSAQGVCRYARWPFRPGDARSHVPAAATDRFEASLRVSHNR